MATRTFTAEIGLAKLALKLQPSLVYDRHNTLQPWIGVGYP